MHRHSGRWWMKVTDPIGYMEGRDRPRPIRQRGPRLTSSDYGNLFEVIIIIILIMGAMSLISFGISALLFILAIIWPIGLFIVGCSFMNSFIGGSKILMTIGVIFMLFCVGGIYHHMFFALGGNAPAQHTSKTVNNIDNTLDNLWGNVGPNRNNSSSDFVNGQSNSSYQQQGNLINTQTQPSIKNEGKYTGSGTDDTHVKHSGNHAVAHYDVYYDYDNSNPNSSLNTETVAKRYAWVAHLQKIHGKWLVKTNTSNNKVISHS